MVTEGSIRCKLALGPGSMAGSFSIIVAPTTLNLAWANATTAEKIAADQGEFSVLELDHIGIPFKEPVALW